MKRSSVAAVFFVVAAIIVAVVAADFFMFISQQFPKEATAAIPGSSHSFSLDPFNNTSGTMFTLSMTLSDYRGGLLTLDTVIAIKSTYFPATPAENVTLFRLTQGTPYAVAFFPVVTATTLGRNTGSGHSRISNSNTSSLVAGGPVLIWTAGSDWVVPMTSMDLPAGSYSISYQLMFTSIEPGQSALNVTSAASSVRLVDLQASSTTTFFGGIQLSNITASTG